jgi:dihydrodipicolinate synthase/N-acetylneuraminate lyase
MLDLLRPRRHVHGASAVFLPFTEGGRPDLDGFVAHLERTRAARLVPAVNMDTGFGPELSPAQRSEVLRLTAPGGAFIAGAFAPYASSAGEIASLGGTPILFPSESLDLATFAAMRTDVLAFELSTAFSPVGRMWDLDDVARLMDMAHVVGMKHSSLSRRLEAERLRLRDRVRPEFRIYTGNDLAIDMVMYGSDYLLGLSSFEPEAFAQRDRWWADGDDRFFALNDALQALGAVAFRDPVPAYKHSAAVYLGLRPHPACPRRPVWESEMLAPFAASVRNAASHTY